MGPAVELYTVGSAVNAAGTSNLTRRGSDEVKKGWNNAQILHNIFMAWCLVYRLRPSDTARLNIQQFYVLPTKCIYVFYVDLRTNSDYFPIQH